MNITSKTLRSKMRVFDTGIWRRVSKTALLKDTAYTLPSPEQFISDFHKAREMLAGLPYGVNEFDCDDIAEGIAFFIKFISRKRSVESGKVMQAYPVFQIALKENHTINYCETDIGPMFGDGGSGQIWGMERKPNVIFVG